MNDQTIASAPAGNALIRWLSVRAYGLVARTLFGARTAPAFMRTCFERFAGRSRGELRRRYPALTFDDYRVGPLTIEAVRAVSLPNCALLYLHGGAFLFGSAASYRDRARRFSYRLGAEVFVPDYRLAPEHPFPAALEDALAAYQYVRALRPDLPVLIGGDSAGGGLALSLLLRLRDLRERMPDGAVLLSPWTDLSVSGSSVETNRHKDVWLAREHLEQWSRHYAGSSSRHHPLLSPAFAELHALPPMLVLAGEHEVLLDDALRVARGAASAGTPVQLHIGSRMQHDWPLTLPWLAESRRAWDHMQQFVGDICAHAQRRDRISPGFFEVRAEAVRLRGGSTLTARLEHSS